MRADGRGRESSRRGGGGERIASLVLAAFLVAAFAFVPPAVDARSPGGDGAGEDVHGASHAATPAAPRAGRVARFDVPEPGSYALPPIDRIETHALLGTSGRPEDLLAIGPGELALVSFVYLQCNEACPLSTALLHQLDRTLAEDPELAGRVELVTVSFDPARDTPEALAALRARLAPRGRWRFLTARDEAALRPVLADFGQDAVWVPGEPNAPDALRHVLKVFLVDGDRAIRQIYSTGFLDERLVLADLRTLMLPLPPDPRSDSSPSPSPLVGP